MVCGDAEIFTPPQPSPLQGEGAGKILPLNCLIPKAYYLKPTT